MFPCIAPSFNLREIVYRAWVRKSLPWILPTLLLVAALVIGLIAANRWLSGEKFHTFLEQKSSEALKATASFGPLHLGWFELSSPHFHAKGAGTGSLRQLEARGIHGRLNPMALFNGTWQIEEISLEKATLHLGSPNGSKAATPPNESKQAHSSGPIPSPVSWLPSLLVIDVIRTGKADVFVELPSAKILEILGSRVEAHPEGEETRIEGHGGVLKSPFLPTFKIGTVRCRMEKKGVELTGADLSFPEGGKIELEGTFPDTQESLLKGSWSKVPISALLPLLGRQLVGTLDGSATVQWDPAGFHSAEGKIQAPNVILTEIPMMTEVARLTRMDAFRHLFLQQAQASFSIRGGITSWQDVILESKNLIKLIGHGEMQQDGSFSGIFQLGLSSAIVTAIPGASEVFSKDQHDGYFWTPLSVGGNFSHLTEDLTPRIKTAILNNAALLLQQGIRQGLQILGIPNGGTPAIPNTGTNAPGNTVPLPPSVSEPAKAAIDILGGFLK